MYIETVPNRNSRPAILLREGWREGKKVRKRTLANLTDWPAAQVDALRRVLKNEPLMSPEAAFRIERSRPHGHVELMLSGIRRIGLDSVISAKRCRERDLVVALILERLLHPASKLAATRLWHTTTVAEELQVEDADVDEVYAAMDWLLERQARIEAKLVRRHLAEGMPVLYDVSSSYYEGRTCSLMQRGHNRDGKKGRTIVVYGLLADADGRPVALDVYAGNTADPKTVPDQVKKLRKRFGLERVVLVGDRGMLTQTQITHLKQHPGLGWISALRTEAIRKLVDGAALNRSLFDERNLAEITSPEFPGERLVACYNPVLAEHRRRKREALLDATTQCLDKIVREVGRRTRTALSAGEIGQKAGRVLNRFKVGKHFHLTIQNGLFQYARREDVIQREAELDGIYGIRTSEPEGQLSPDDAVRRYKTLGQVEQAFRCLKSVDLLVRPIHHRDETRVRAHIFLCMLAYYLEWHLRKALAPLLFQDETLDRDRWLRDPVLPAQPSPAAKRKKRERQTDDGLPVHSFKTLIADLGTRCRNRCRLQSDPHAPAFDQLTDPTPLQQRAFELLAAFPVQSTPGL
jgi:transposase